METIRRFVERVDDEAIASGLSGVRTLISRRLGSRLLGWTGQLKDAQAAITRRHLRCTAYGGSTEEPLQFCPVA